MNNNNFFNESNNLNNNNTTPITTQNNIPNQQPMNNNMMPNQFNNTQNNNNNNNLIFNQNNIENPNYSQQNINPTNNNMNNQNIIVTPTPITTQPVNNINPIQPNNFPNNNQNPTPIPNFGNNFEPSNYTNDEELLQAFVGKKYDTITTQKFNVAGFFFTSFYMFYRKMFLYGIILFIINFIILNVIDNDSITLLFNLAVGFFINKIYIYQAKQKISKIKSKHPEKNINELKEICAKKGGTSIGQLFLGILIELVLSVIIIIIILLIGFGGIITEIINPNNWNVTTNNNETESNNNVSNSTSIEDATLAKDVSISGYSCFGSTCTFSIKESTDYEDFTFNANNPDYFKILNDYSDYISVDIYYITNSNKKTIIDYKVFIKSTNEEITNITTEHDLRTKLGLYTVGTHTNTFTLTEEGMTGAGFDNDTSYTYTTYTFVDDKNNEYEMQYIHSNGKLNLEEGNTYTITFEVIEGTFEYEFNIKSIK